MVICTLCLAKHLYIHNEDDPLYYEVRAAEIKENTILKRIVKRKKRPQQLPEIRRDSCSSLRSADRISIRDSICSRLSIDTNESGSGNCCHICLDEFRPGDIVSQSKNPLCTHTFHEACIAEWLMVPHDSCPVCRNAFLVGYYDEYYVAEGDEENHPRRSHGHMEIIGNQNESSARDGDGNQNETSDRDGDGSQNELSERNVADDQNEPLARDVADDQNEPLARDVVAL